MATINSIRWGILGTSDINRLLIPALRTVEHNEVAAVASRDRHKALVFSQEWEIPRWYGDYGELLADSDIDAVYIPLPNTLHAEWTIRAAEAGKHVLCEKPFAVTSSEVDRMVEAARDRQVVLAEALMYRHQPVIIKIKELVDSGAIGELLLIRGTFNRQLRIAQHDIRLNPRLGGGSLWDIGYYPVSLARYVVGDDPIEAFGWEQKGSTGVDLSFVGQLRFPQGVFLQMECSLQHPSSSRVDLMGRDGSISLERAFNYPTCTEIVLTSGNEVGEIPFDPVENRYLGQVEEITECILRAAIPLVSHSESRGSVAAVQALMLSAQSGQPEAVH